MDRNKVRFTLIIMVTFAAVGAVASLIFSNFISFEEVKGIRTTGPASPRQASGDIFYNPPAPEDAPAAIKEAVMLGYHILMDTQKYAPAYVGNRLKCRNCHFKGGLTEGGKGGGLSLVGVGATYPEYRTREHYAADLMTRTNDCFTRSLNGKALPSDSKEITQSLPTTSGSPRGCPFTPTSPGWV